MIAPHLCPRSGLIGEGAEFEGGGGEDAVVREARSAGAGRGAAAELSVRRRRLPVEAPVALVAVLLLVVVVAAAKVVAAAAKVVAAAVVVGTSGGGGLRWGGQWRPLRTSAMRASHLVDARCGGAESPGLFLPIEFQRTRARAWFHLIYTRIKGVVTIFHEETHVNLRF
jgi:hypothetical protein